MKSVVVCLIKDSLIQVYIEDMHLRTRSETGRAGKNRCFDFVQFGRDDLVPFFTLFKSEELCGNQTGFHYDEPGGKLLVWLNLGHSRLETQDNIRLTVVVTAYKHGRTEDTTNFRYARSRISFNVTIAYLLHYKLES